MLKKLFLFANWKMYLDNAESEKLAREFGKIKYPKGSKVAVFPSAIAVERLAPILKKGKISLGAQNIHPADRGAYTGEISAPMYGSLRCTHALVGHAERRHLFHESNVDTRQKLEAVLKAKMTPVLCVGETAEERKGGRAEAVIEAELRAAFADLAWPKGVDVIVAYEPVWAIGTGESCDPREAKRMAKFVSGLTMDLLGRMPDILYGGSVKAENIRDYIDQSNISGALVGGASAKKESWAGLIANLF